MSTHDNIHPIVPGKGPEMHLDWITSIMYLPPEQTTMIRKMECAYCPH